MLGPGWGGKSGGGLSEEIQLYPEIRPLKFQDHKVKENQFLITFKPQGYRKISTEQHPPMLHLLSSDLGQGHEFLSATAGCWTCGWRPAAGSRAWGCNPSCPVRANVQRDRIPFVNGVWDETVSEHSPTRHIKKAPGSSQSGGAFRVGLLYGHCNMVGVGGKEAQGGGARQDPLCLL